MDNEDNWLNEYFEEESSENNHEEELDVNDYEVLYGEIYVDVDEQKPDIDKHIDLDLD